MVFLEAFSQRARKLNGTIERLEADEVNADIPEAGDSENVTMGRFVIHVVHFHLDSCTLELEYRHSVAVYDLSSCRA